MNKQGYSKYLLMGVIILGMVIMGANTQEAAAFDSGSTCIDTLASTCLGTFSPPTQYDRNAAG